MTKVASDRIYSIIFNHKQNYNRRHTEGIFIHYFIFYQIITQS